MDIFSNYKLDRARVKEVIFEARDGGDKLDRVVIIASPISLGGEAEEELSVAAPNIIPNSSTGAGVFSYPTTGQECIIARDIESGSAWILTYIPGTGGDASGDYISGELGMTEGGVALKCGGYETSKLMLNPEGKIELGSNRFSRLNIDGEARLVELNGFRFRKEFFSGGEVRAFDEETEATTKLDWSNISYENPGFSDRGLDLEKGIEIPVESDFVDKVVIRSGDLHDNFAAIPDGVVYSLETRQASGDTVGSLGGSEKDVVSSLRLGLDKGDGRYKGTIKDWRFKLNLKDSVDVFTERLGKIEASSNSLSGEVYNKSLLIGVNNSAKLGLSTWDTCGEGVGWDFDDSGLGRSDTGVQMVTSFGWLHRDSRLDARINSSLFRERIKDKNSKLEVLKVVGGDKVIYEEVGNANFNLKKSLSENGEIVNKVTAGEKTLGETWTRDDYSLSASTNASGKLFNTSQMKLGKDYLWVERIKPDVGLSSLQTEDAYIQLGYHPLSGSKRTDTISDNILRLEDDKIIVESSGGSRVLMEEGEVELVAGVRATDDANIKIDNSDFNLKFGNSSITIDDTQVKLESGAGSITVTPTSISLVNAAGHDLLLDSTGLTFNGRSVVLDTFLDWMSQNSSKFCISSAPGSPSPLFPDTLAVFQVKDALPVSSEEPQSFRSSI